MCASAASRRLEAACLISDRRDKIVAQAVGRRHRHQHDEKVATKASLIDETVLVEGVDRELGIVLDLPEKDSQALATILSACQVDQRDRSHHAIEVQAVHRARIAENVRFVDAERAPAIAGRHVHDEVMRSVAATAERMRASMS